MARRNGAAAQVGPRSRYTIDMSTLQAYDDCIEGIMKPHYLGEFEYSILLAILQIEIRMRCRSAR